MRLFLDENVDPLLAERLTEYEVESVRTKGWFGISNGELLARIEADFDALITHDKGLVHQQNWQNRNLALLVLDTVSTSFSDYEASLSQVIDSLAKLKAGIVIRLKL